MIFFPARICTVVAILILTSAYHASAATPEWNGAIMADYHLLVEDDSVNSSDNRFAENEAETPAAKKTRRYTVVKPDKEAKPRYSIGPIRYTIGGIIGTYPGFGLGHVVQGRWQERGWIFTLAEPVSFLVAITGALSLYNNVNNGAVMMVAGAVALVGFKIWEIIDVWAGDFDVLSDDERMSRNNNRIYLQPTSKQQKSAVNLVWEFQF